MSGRVVFGDQLGSGLGHGDEAIVFRNKVGFAVHFDQGTQVAFNKRGDHTFSGHAACGFTCFGAQFHAQQLFGLGHVAGGFGQGFFALHHGGVGFATQFSDHACGNCSHFDSPYSVQCFKNSSYKKGAT